MKARWCYVGVRAGIVIRALESLCSQDGGPDFIPLDGVVLQNLLHSWSWAESKGMKQ